MLWEELGTTYHRGHKGLSQNYFFSCKSEVREIREFLLNLQKVPHWEMELEGRRNKNWKFLARQKQNPRWPWPIRKMVCQKKANIWCSTGTELGNPCASQIQTTWIPAEEWLVKPSLWVTPWINGNKIGQLFKGLGSVNRVTMYKNQGTIILPYILH